MSSRTIALGCALAILAPGSVALADHHEGMKKKTTDKSAKITKSSAGGRALAKLPRDCDSLAYVDVTALSSSALVGDNASLLRDRAREALEDVPSGDDLKLTLSRLSAQGMSADTAKELALCVKDEKTFLTIAADFGGKDPVASLAAAGERHDKDDSIYITERGGHQYATIPTKNGNMYALEIAPGVVGVAGDTSMLDAAAKRKAEAPKKSGDIAFMRTRYDDGRVLTTALEPVAKSYILKTAVTKRGAFDPIKDGQRWTEARDAWAKKLGETPLAPIADDVGRGAVVATKDALRLQIVLPSRDVSDALANAAKSPRQHWGALGADAPRAIGGGPLSQPDK